MVFCCVPKCDSDSWKCDPSITFHDFPSSPDLAAKWIQQINCAVKCHPMWFPKGKSVLCSKHFLSTDFKDDSDTLKPRIVPTVFGFKYIGHSPDVEEIQPKKNKNVSASPLIVKIKTEEEEPKVESNPSENSEIYQIEEIINEPEPYIKTPVSQTPTVAHKTLQTYSKLNPKINNETILKSGSESFIKNTVSQNTNITHTTKPLQTDSKMGVKLIVDNSVQFLGKTPSKMISSNNLSSKNSSVNKPEGVVIENETSSQNSTVNELSSTPIKNEKSTKKLPQIKLSNMKNKLKQKIKKPAQKRENNDNLIEIGPNTFLKINPDIIKINKKLTPSGNTVLQFLMDQTLANTIGTDVLPKIVQGAISNIGGVTNNLMREPTNLQANADNPPADSVTPKTDGVVQHVVGHLVDTHVCQDSCVKLQEIDDILMETDMQETGSVNSSLAGEDKAVPKQSPSLTAQPLLDTSNKNAIQELNKSQNTESPISKEKADTSCISKAPVLLTTNMSLAHCFMEKTKYLNNLRQKARQIASLKQKVSKLTKKIEELEDKCIVQERQLSFSFLKRLRSIHKNASKGDPSATYILEQIRAYTGQKQMRWSDSTLQQCAVWCRKAPYAYEYFKKADFFKLPCLGTVKRFMRNHPEMTFTHKSSTNAAEDDDASSSDFDFDEESMDDQDKDGHAEAIMCETVMSEEGSNPGHAGELTGGDNTAIKNTNEETAMECDNTVENSSEISAVPGTVKGTNLELQELILPSGEVVQCYSSNLCNGTDVGNQYYIIPSEGDQNSNQEYSIIQSAESVPVILQNIDSSHMHQEQLIFITNSTEHVECTETEVVTAQ